MPDDFPTVLSGSAAEPILRTLGDVVIYTERGADQEEELIRRIADAHVVVSLRAYSKFSTRVLTGCPSLRLISIWGTGTDNVDVAACHERNVTVMNTPGVNAHAVAEHTLALMLAVTRRIPSMDAAVRRGEWPRGQLVQLEGKTLGVVGLGTIGCRVASLAAAFGMRVLTSTWGPDAGRSDALSARNVDIETLLGESDVVSLHMRLTAETREVLSRDRIAVMKPTAFLINTARAGLVDRAALIDALREGRLAGAGLDVFHEEPIAADDPLLALSNVVLTPHIAGMTPEVIDVGLRRAVENVDRFLHAG